MINNNIYGFEFEKVEIPTPKEDLNRSDKYIKWGVDNKYPNFLLDLYYNSPEHQTIIDGIVMYTVGNGLKTENTSLQVFFNKLNRYDENINDIIKKIELDYNIFGGFALQVIYSKSGNISELYWVDFNRIRVDYDEKLVYYSNDWGKWGAKFEVYPIFNPSEKVKSSIFVYKGDKTRTIYPIPLYVGSIKSIITLNKINDYYLNEVTNGFQPTTLINFNNGDPSPDDKKIIEDQIKNKFTGTSGNKTLITFNDGKEKSTEISKLDSDNADQKFKDLYRNVQNNIFTAHKITSPSIFGVVQETQGFSKTEFVEAFEIFNNTVIKSHQKNIIWNLNKILKYYFTDFNLSFNEFKINIE